MRNHHNKKGTLHSDFVTLQILATSAQNLMLLGLNAFWAKAQKSVQNHKGYEGYSKLEASHKCKIYDTFHMIKINKLHLNVQK